MKSQTRVVLTKFAEKQLVKIPRNIKEVLMYWAETVEKIGIRDTRKLRGYHDELLKVNRQGQRSVRLNKAYRAIYIETCECIEICVIEVSKHEY